MLRSIIVGLVLATVTIVIHAVGTYGWVARLRRSPNPSASPDRLLASARVLCATAIYLLFLHIVEVTVWAVAYLLVVGGQSLTTFEQSIYFSTVTFAALGYGDVVIEGPWRLLSAIQAMMGLLVFGWSSALLFAVVQRILHANDMSFASEEGDSRID